MDREVQERPLSVPGWGLTGRGGSPGASMSLEVITPTLGSALGLVGALQIVDGFGWRVVAAMFGQERLVTGKRT